MHDMVHGYPALQLHVTDMHSLEQVATRDSWPTTIEQY